MHVTIVADQGTHLLITNGSCYAVIERRGDRLCDCHDRDRDGIPAAQLSNVERLLDASDWTDQQTAQATFEQIVARGTQLAQRML